MPVDQPSHCRVSPCASPPGTSIRSSSASTTWSPGSPSAQPDIVCLQETKCVDEAFPREPFEALGYNVAVHGQKTFNGVAHPVEAAVRRGDAGPARRRRRRPRPLPRGGGVDQDRRGAGGQPLSAQRQSAGHATNITTSSNGWTGLLPFHMNGWSWKSRSSWPATTTSSRRAADARNPEAWVKRRAVPAADAREVPRARSISG